MSGSVASGRQEIEAALRRIGGQKDQAIDLAPAALTLAALAQPEASLDHYLHHLSLLARDTADQVRTLGAGLGTGLEARVEALRQVMVERYGYVGDRESYDDLQNANLMRVIDRRRGLPVTLGILYIHAARSQGWTVAGLNFPGHFVIRLELEGERAILDPFDRAARRSPAELRDILKQIGGAKAEIEPGHYATVGNRSILLRLQNNIKLRLLRDKRPEEALGVLEAMLMIAPAQAGLWREAGSLNAQLGNLRAAIISLEHFLDLGRDPNALRQAREHLRQLKTRLN